MDDGQAGWHGTLPEFIDEEAIAIRTALEEFIEDASESQKRAWRDSIPQLKGVLDKYLGGVPVRKGGVILEYREPGQPRRRCDESRGDGGGSICTHE